VVIDPVAGSGSTLVAANNLGRKGYGFEIKKDFYQEARKWIDECEKVSSEIKARGYSQTLMKIKENQNTLFDYVRPA